MADGFEELEAIGPIDLLRRAELEVVTVGVMGKTVTGAHGVPFTADKTVQEIALTQKLQAVVLPGGMPGTINLEKDTVVRQTVAYAAAEGKLVCAICAAPSILGHMGLLQGRRAVCFPGFEQELAGAQIGEQSVVRDGNLITAKGAGVAVDFALEILRALGLSAQAEKIRRSIQCP